MTKSNSKIPKINKEKMLTYPWPEKEDKLAFLVENRKVLISNLASNNQKNNFRMKKFSNYQYFGSHDI